MAHINKIAMLSVVMSFVLSTTAHARSRSVYTSLEVKNCKLEEDDPEHGAYSTSQCPGNGDYTVFYNIFDDRDDLTLSNHSNVFMLELPRRLAKTGFPELGLTLEWREHQKNKQWIPHALIAHYLWTEEEKQRDVLAIIQLSPTNTCAVAAIDTHTHRDALKRARRYADQLIKYPQRCKDIPFMQPLTIE